MTYVNELVQFGQNFDLKKEGIMQKNSMGGGDNSGHKGLS